ncbi:PREDICTED: uncharacterized protein LOC109339208 isoform X3 [Lupinus angustifolius]|uniref:uncharacterized protein LOC109339208 isoform X2 n=1 Tax=Lupinus angustifolius TaxID=3871 RepID=UPI00092F0FB8|nr:PREDICTED: uncharacterized protein LOC109339208 isoform X2 [Lupinus angustifolius]XP_019432175.1 PREDICTED: uncharacterized protein LOC109339208 isoform X3 [Lupinus angustifolius]
MGNSLRCCLACVLPCGALDLIRIVHLSGYVEEITRPITAQEVLNANPNHVLSKPSSQGVVRRILILSPETELKRGSIYFLIPSSSLPAEKNKKKKYDHSNNECDHDDGYITVTSSSDDEKVSKEKKSSRRHRRHSHSGVWQPHLESITEDLY